MYIWKGQEKHTLENCRKQTPNMTECEMTENKQPQKWKKSCIWELHDECTSALPYMMLALHLECTTDSFCIVMDYFPTVNSLPAVTFLKQAFFVYSISSQKCSFFSGMHIFSHFPRLTFLNPTCWIWPKNGWTSHNCLK